MGICAGCLRERGVFGERDAVSNRAGSGTPARILTAGNWLYKKEEKHLFGVRMRQKCGWELRELKDGFY